jgi:ribosomal subunit interface protein
MIKNITSGNLDFTKSIKKSADYHLNKIEQLQADITRVDLIIKKDGKDYVAEVNSHVARRACLNSLSRGTTINSAINGATTKMVTQIKKIRAKTNTFKKKIAAKKHQRLNEFEEIFVL